MDGLRPTIASSSAQSRASRIFAEDLLAGAQAITAMATHIALGPGALRLTFASDGWIDAFIAGAFHPVPAPGHTDREPHLVISGVGTQPHLPPLAWATPWIERQQAVPFEITYPFRIHIDRHAGVVSVLDTVTRSGAVWLRREAELDARILVTPFRVILNWYAGLLGGSLVHAAANVIAGRGLVLSGPSGSGKSTLAVALSNAGQPIVSDDCVLLHGSTVYSVFTRAKLDRRSFALLAHTGLRPQRIPGGDFPKSYLLLSDLGPHFAPSAPVDSLAFPSLAPSGGAYRMSVSEANRALFDDSSRETGGGTERDRLRLATLCRATPAFRLLMTSPEQGCRLATEIMAETGALPAIT